MDIQCASMRNIFSLRVISKEECRFQIRVPGSALVPSMGAFVAIVIFRTPHSDHDPITTF